MAKEFLFPLLNNHNNHSKKIVKPLFVHENKKRPERDVFKYILDKAYLLEIIKSISFIGGVIDL
ncbi:hypothetical protein FGF1_10360 [Flavobacteriaceae bacterium GF1]